MASDLFLDLGTPTHSTNQERAPSGAPRVEAPRDMAGPIRRQHFVRARRLSWLAGASNRFILPRLSVEGGRAPVLLLRPAHHVGVDGSCRPLGGQPVDSDGGA